MRAARPRLFGIYVHLPFCDVKCAYCDFFSIAARHTDAREWQRYTERLLADLQQQYSLLTEDTPQPVLASIFFGGGTPSKAPPQLFERVITAIKAQFAQKLPAVEITAEANPESLTRELLDAWRSAGINRISVGMQSRDEKVLKYLGRLFNAHAYRRVLADIRSAGFTNFSADFITGVPGQSEISTLGDLAFALGEGAPHLSLYQLTLESGTLLKQRVATGKQAALDDAQQILQMDAADKFLTAQNFDRYEISNFALPGRRSLHNSLYWTGRPYLGLGVAAHMFTGRRRFYHARSLEKYLSGVGPVEDTEATARDVLINRLRLNRPLHSGRIFRLYEESQRGAVAAELNRAVERGWLLRRGEILQPTRMGFRFTDSLLASLWNL
ncbi:MAG: radical SAM family heme chaperone HemW [Spirochaetes bacterium]|nr:radical SAM family heme chaperone HemW [Spirochaetota bacterium]